MATDAEWERIGRAAAESGSRGLGRRVARTAFQSSPSNSAENCAGDRAITLSDGRGQPLRA